MSNISIDYPLFIGEIIFIVSLIYGIIKLWGNNIFDILFITKKQNQSINQENYEYPTIIIPKTISNYSSYQSNGNIELSKVKEENNIHNWLINNEITQSMSEINMNNIIYINSFINKQQTFYKEIISNSNYYNKIKLLQGNCLKYFNNSNKIVYSPNQKGYNYFYYKREKTNNNDGIDQISQPSLYYTKNIRKEGKLLLDLNQLLIDSGYVVVGSWISDDGLKLAYGVTQWIDNDSNFDNGYDMTIYVRDVFTGEDSAVDIVYGCHNDRTNITWLEGHIGFFYTRYYYDNIDSSTTEYESEPDDMSTTSATANTSMKNDSHSSSNSNKNQIKTPKIFFHRLKTTQANDLLIYEEPIDEVSKDILHPNLSSLYNSTINIPYKTYIPTVTHDGNYLIIEEFDQRLYKTNSTIPPRISQQSLTDELGSYCLGNRVHYRDISIFDGKRLNTIGPMVLLIDNYNFRFEYITNIQEHIFFRTNFQAFRFRIVELLANGQSSNNDPSISNDDSYDQSIPYNVWDNIVEYISEHNDNGVLLRCFVSFQTILILQYLINGSYDVILYDLLQSNLGLPLVYGVANLPHPLSGVITTVHSNYNTSTIFYEFNSLNEPNSVFRADIRRNSQTGFIELSFDQLCKNYIPGIQLDNYDIQQEIVKTSRSDANNIPIFLFSNKEFFYHDKLKSSPKSCLLFVYGAFGVSTLPTFNPLFLLYLKTFDGLVCIANIRGGSEKGRNWHSFGSYAHKPTSINDINDVAQYLINEGYTTPSQLAYFGGSIGGCLLMNAMIQRPGLCSALVIDNGLFDLLQYPNHSTSTTTDQTIDSDDEDNLDTINLSDQSYKIYQQKIHESIKEEFGDPDLSIDEFNMCLSISPLHNCKHIFENCKPKDNEIKDIKTDSRKDSHGNNNNVNSKKSKYCGSVAANIRNGSNSLKSTISENNHPPAILLCSSYDALIDSSNTYRMINELQKQAIINKYNKTPFIARIETEDDFDSSKSYNTSVRQKYSDILGFISYHTKAIENKDE